MTTRKLAKGVQDLDNRIEILDELLHEKLRKDWDVYCKKELQFTKEELIHRSYRNALAGEWRYFFANIFDDYYIESYEKENGLEITIKMLLNLQNIFDELVKDSCSYDSIDFNPESFIMIFEGFVEGKCGILI